MRVKFTNFRLLEPSHDSLTSQISVPPSKIIGYVNWRFWGLWILVLLVAFIVQLLTLDVLPHLQQDEAQITDYGRLTLDPKSNWSVTWRIAEGKPLLLWTYLGPLIAEASFQLGGSSGLGPRVASLLGGLVAGTMALGWLIARKVPIYAAFFLSLAFMLDPLFVLSQRMARMDSWVIALCFGCCWLLESAPNSKSKSLFIGQILAAGGLAAMAAFVWPSAVFLYPLIMLELFQLAVSKNAYANRSKYILSLGFYFALGGLIIAAILIIPIWQNLLIIFSDMTTMVTRNVDSSKSIHDRFFALFNIQSWLKMIKAFVKTFSPFFPLFALVAAVLHRNKGWILVFIVTIVMIFTSLVYEFRVLYLIPYCLVIISKIFNVSTKRQSSFWLKRFSIIMLSILVIWSVGTSLLIRTALGLQGKTERDRNKIYQVASTTIGPGNYNVFLAFTYEFYYVGRSLGWKLYTPYIEFAYDKQGNWIRNNDYKPTNKFVALLSKMDYAVFNKGAVTKELEKQLAMSGLYFSDTLRVGTESVSTKETYSQNSANGIFLWFLQGKENYGSFILYARDKISKNNKVPIRFRQPIF